MAKFLTVVMPALEQLPTGEYSITIGDDEPHHGQQVFKAASVEELCGKLAQSCQYATQHIRALSRELDDLRSDYSITRDVAVLATTLLVIKGADTPANRALDTLIKKLSRELTARLPADTNDTNT